MRDIILNESTVAAGLLAGTTKVEDVRSAASLIARYDIQAVGLDTDTTKWHVRQTVKKLYSHLREDYYGRYVDYYVDHAHELPLSQLSGVPITQSELDCLGSLPSIRAKCLAFTLLAMAKYDTIRFPTVNFWVNGDRWNEIMKRANLALTEDEMCYMLYDIKEAGLVKFSERIDNTSIQVLFADMSDEPVFELVDTDYRDLGYCLRAYCGEKYTRCEECGRWVKQMKNNRKRFCNDCAADSRRAKDRERKRRQRG